MKKIIFIDTEVSLKEQRIVDFGGITEDDSKLSGNSLTQFVESLKDYDYICGHNIIHHDIKYLEKETKITNYFYGKAIDTLYLSPLLFPKKPYHRLLKDDKLVEDEKNNPLNDAIKARRLFYEEVDAFNKLHDSLKSIYYSLLGDVPEFKGFFDYLEYREKRVRPEKEIISSFYGKVCHNANLEEIIRDNPVELAYCLALINVDDKDSITPPWVLKQYPVVNNVMHKLRSVPCRKGCPYCKDKLDIHKALKKYFGYDSYRKFGGVPLQEQAVKAAVENKSLLAVFPTGGGKSLTFQVPALLAGSNTKALTVVISPLQSLMKDQVDNLEQRSITDAVTINGMLDPIERAQAIHRVLTGEATILYIAPETLRSKTIEKLLVSRNISRFVIDEAHCFSAWGQDFRVDYLYIADFIKRIKKLKNLTEDIPVSCFTATAKQPVINDILNYFQENLNLRLEKFTTEETRKNLNYRVIPTTEEKKYQELRRLLSYKNCPTIIYVSRTRKTEELAKRLTQDGYKALCFHGRMDKNKKSDNQEAFMRGEVNIIVATSAFGMGVDKKNVGMVIHYDISDSLENYLQEAGRAGRDQNITAECYILYNDEDLNKHFYLLNQTKVSLKEIEQVWKAIKGLTKFRSGISVSALELAREAGWNELLEGVTTRVTTAIAALEDAGFIKRGLNSPRVFANSILAKNMIEAREKIEKSRAFSEEDKTMAIRIIKLLISNRSRKKPKEEPDDNRLDSIADYLGIKLPDVIRIVQQLREIEVLADTKDIVVNVDETNAFHKALNLVNDYEKLELFLLENIETDESVINIKSLNEKAEQSGLKNTNPKNLRRILNFWAIKKNITQELAPFSPNHLIVRFNIDKDILKENIKKRIEIARVIIEFLENSFQETEKTVFFSILDIINEYNKGMLQFSINASEVEDAVLYLSGIKALKIEGGFLVIYNPLSIERLEKDNKIHYKQENYKKLKRHYEQKMQMIHIVGEYARMLIEDYKAALSFVRDYFKMNYNSFLAKYFKGTKGEVIQKNITHEKFKQLFGALSPEQLKIINDVNSQYIVVAAGPGSGKTRILVHKLASLLYMEDVKHDQLLMLTFSRAAASEFKKRLIELIGSAAHYIEIKTFHSYCFDILGRVGNIDSDTAIIAEATKRIENDEVDPSRITKTVLVIDEAQDMDENEFRLIEALIAKNENMRVIAVGDDDQNIYAFRGSDSKYMQELLKRENAVKYELVLNYRSKANLIQFTNVFAESISSRIKKTPIIPKQQTDGRIDVVHYKREVLVPAVMKHIESGFSGSTCILAKTNHEALQVVGLLLKNNIQAKLIRSNDRYRLSNMVELRYFLDELKKINQTHLITSDNWEETKRRFKMKYGSSDNYDLCAEILDVFETVNGEYKYLSDFEWFLIESKEEDFYERNQSKIVVSTIHKSKGWEFDHIIMILDNFTPQTDDEKRQLYVGLTRAKERLSIHYSGNYFDKKINPEYGYVKNLVYRYDNQEYESSNFIIFQLSLQDVYLSYFNSSQRQIRYLKSGDKLKVDNEGCLDKYNNYIIKFSRKFKDELEKYFNKGYQLTEAVIKNIVYWRENDENEILVVLPQIELTRQD